MVLIFHDTKIEKFCVIKGKAIIRFRQILSEEVISYYVSDECIQVIDIPPGYTHSLENVSKNELVVMFWAGELFDPIKHDTYFKEVQF